MQFILSYKSEDGSVEIEDLGGVSWVDAPIPHAWHKCEPQTRGWTDYFNQVFRCACGATGLPYGNSITWMERNSRRAHQKRRAQEAARG